MKNILINPHNCSREEYAELKQYLEDNCWDYKEVDENPVDEKTEIINNIKKIISEYGGFTIGEVEADCSPLINSMGKDNIILAERFGLDTVTGVTYVHETETDRNEFDYSDLDLDTLQDILDIVEGWEADQEQTDKRCAY